MTFQATVLSPIWCDKVISLDLVGVENVLNKRENGVGDSGSSLSWGILEIDLFYSIF